MPLALFALAIASFAIGTSEFVIMGILPKIAQDLHLSIPAAGLLVTTYALTVTFGGPVVALAAAKLPKKIALLTLLGVFIGGNFLCALAPSFPTLLIARFLTALSHGSFYGTAVVVAAGLVEPERRSRAIALMFSGMTLANIIGVPLGTILGLTEGWRATFLAIVPIGLIAAAALAFLVPSQESEAQTGRLRDEFIVLRRPQVLLTLGASVLISTSLFSVLTFIAPLLASVTGMSEQQVSGALLVFGFGTFVGIFAGGRLADWKQMPAIMGIFAALAATYGALTLTSLWLVPAFVTVGLLGMTSFAAGPGLQARVLDKAHEAPNLGATLIQSAFNLGNGAGAWVGSAALAAGLGYQQLPWISLALILAALAVTAMSRQLDRGAALVSGCSS
jgi:DHA1 family inner membrane transport protein